MSKHVRAYERSSAQYHEKDSPQKLITEHVRETTRVSYAEDDREQTNKILEIERERESLRNPPERGGGPPSLMEEASARASLAMKRAGAETARRLSRDLREDEEEEEEED